MIFPFASTDAAAKCIGSYERELHAEVDRIVAAGYRAIVNIGCAEGFYAVGFARSMPGTIVHAYDTSDAAVQQCRDLAAANNIRGDQIRYGGLVTHEVLGDVCGPNTLVLTDIEGAEAELLDPVAAPRLREVDILVELHHHVVPHIEKLLRERFEGTHVIRHVDSEPRVDPERYPELVRLAKSDQLLALFERPIIMRWLLLTVRTA